VRLKAQPGAPWRLWLLGRPGRLLRGTPAPTKSEKDIMGEIQAIIRQITASVTFLPMLEDQCTFDLLVYTRADSEVPQQWCAIPCVQLQFILYQLCWLSHPLRCTARSLCAQLCAPYVFNACVAPL
jgi:hypothetical protein